MVVDSLLHALPIPDPRPAKADPEQRAKRKQHEKEHPHFQMQEFGLKAGVLALMAAVAVYPWEKKYEEHVEKNHPERLEGKGKGKREGREKERRRRRRRSVGDADASASEGGRGGKESLVEDNSWRGSEAGGGMGVRRDRRRASVAVAEDHTAGRQRGYVDDRGGRGGAVGAAAGAAGSQRGRADFEETRAARRRSVDPVALRLAIADGFSYVPQDRGYIDRRENVDADWDRRPREFVPDEYAFRPRRMSGDRRNR